MLVRPNVLNKLTAPSIVQILFNEG